MGRDKIHGLTIQQLRTFAETYEKQNYSLAAHALRLSAPAVWEQMRAMEQRYDTPLFVRQGRGVAPTTAARKLYPHVLQILAAADASVDLLQDDRHELPPQLTIAMGASMRLDLAPALAEFRSSVPGNMGLN